IESRMTCFICSSFLRHYLHKIPQNEHLPPVFRHQRKRFMQGRRIENNRGWTTGSHKSSRRDKDVLIL
ncbi:hypothetical protein L9F63_015564, partial [Diploptera punctata]